MTRTKYSVTFTLLPRKRSDGTHTIRMSISWKSRRVLCYLPIGAHEDQWDSSAMIARPSRAHRDVSEVNNTIFDFRNKVTDIFDTAGVADRIPTEEEVSRVFSTQEETTQEEMHPISELLEVFIKKQSAERGWVPLTARKFRILDRELTAAGLKNIEEMNADGVQKYLQWITDRDYENAVAMKKVSILRWFLNWCRREGIINSDEYMLRGLHLKCPQKVVIYLDWDELIQLYQFDYGDYQALSNVRDVFCLCAFTGLRFSDAAKLRWENVKKDYISIVTQKTSEPLTIELNDFSAEILERCARRSNNSMSQTVLPVISIQKSNEHLKDCAMLAQIDAPIQLTSYKGSVREEKRVLKWEVITTHCARRTFVVNALRLGIPAEVIMKWTGHSDFKAMRPYVAIVDDLKRENMSRFKKSLIL